MQFPNLAIPVLCHSLLTGVALALPLQHPYTIVQRGLIGILGGGDEYLPPAVTQEIQVISVLTLPPSASIAGSNTPLVGYLHGNGIQQTRLTMRPTLAGQNAGDTTERTSTAVIFAPQQVTTKFIPIETESPQEASMTLPTNSVLLGPSVSLPSTDPSDPGYVQDASMTPPAELKEWKVIGVAVISITFLGIVVLSITFFDAWWSFVREALCCWSTRRGSSPSGQMKHGKHSIFGFGEEVLVPDWEKRSWEFKLASEDGHRYPTMASLESIVKERDGHETIQNNSDMNRDIVGSVSSGLKPPQMAYRGH